MLLPCTMQSLGCNGSTLAALPAACITASCCIADAVTTLLTVHEGWHHLRWPAAQRWTTAHTVWGKKKVPLTVCRLNMQRQHDTCALINCSTLQWTTLRANHIIHSEQMA